MEEMTTIGEILEFAIGREAEAVEFYMAMADRVKNPSIQRFFEDLVTEELEHKSRLELEVMKEGIVARTVGVLPDISGGGGPVVDPDRVTEQMVYTEALGMAILKEKRAFRLYVRLAGLVMGEELGETLLSLAEEEAKHLVAIEEQYKNATTGRQWPVVLISGGGQIGGMSPLVSLLSPPRQAYVTMDLTFCCF
ncbi:MAG: ferritin family protein [Planctomycetota bacterium]|nr:ferritin family protein [Planctomycetota bacterium]